MLTKIKQAIVGNCFLSALHDPSDTDNCAAKLHKLFIEEQIRMLEEMLPYPTIAHGNVPKYHIKELISQLKDQLK